MTKNTKPPSFDWLCDNSYFHQLEILMKTSQICKWFLDDFETLDWNVDQNGPEILEKSWTFSALSVRHWALEGKMNGIRAAGNLQKIRFSWKNIKTFVNWWSGFRHETFKLARFSIFFILFFFQYVRKSQGKGRFRV